MYIYAVITGKVHFMKDPMCVYRFQHPGSWTSNNKQINYDHLICEINWMNKLDEETQHKYQNFIYSHLFLRFYKGLVNIPYYLSKKNITHIVQTYSYPYEKKPKWLIRFQKYPFWLFYIMERIRRMKNNIFNKGK